MAALAALTDLCITPSVLRAKFFFLSSCREADKVTTDNSTFFTASIDRSLGVCKLLLLFLFWRHFDKNVSTVVSVAIGKFETDVSFYNFKKSLLVYSNLKLL